jgi:hypothetical protein
MLPERSSINYGGIMKKLKLAKPVIKIVRDETEAPQKNPAAVALGRLGGLKGGRARAEKLSADERKEIARKAAVARWSVQPLGGSDE